jgi:hypothetical protein
MSLRDLVTFKSEFPDDAQWDDRKNLLVPGGQSIADAIRSQLEEKGIACTEVTQHSFHGWGFQATVAGLVVWCLVQGGHEWFLRLEQRRSLLQTLLGPDYWARFARLQDHIQAIMMADNRFSNVLWHATRDYEGGLMDRGQPVPRSTEASGNSK